MEAADKKQLEDLARVVSESLEFFDAEQLKAHKFKRYFTRLLMAFTAVVVIAAGGLLRGEMAPGGGFDITTGALVLIGPLGLGLMIAHHNYNHHMYNADRVRFNLDITLRHPAIH